MAYRCPARRATSTTSIFNALDQLQTSTTNGLNTTYNYDGHGNLSLISNASGATTYAYDAQDRLVNAVVPAGTNITFAYDADGHRINQTVGAQATKYLWDTLSPYGDVIRETDGTGTPLASYILGGMELLSQTRAGVTNFYLHDGQGSTRTLINTSGTVTDTYVYDAFGNGQHTAGATNNAYQYTGQQFDAGTGLYDLRARYYDPGLGRFGSRDRMGVDINEPIELNRYMYSANRPINLSDPTGYSASLDLSGISRFVQKLGSSVPGRIGLGFTEGAVAGVIGYAFAVEVAARIKAALYVASHPPLCSFGIISQDCWRQYYSQYQRNHLTWQDLVIALLFGGSMGAYYAVMPTPLINIGSYLSLEAGRVDPSLLFLDFQVGTFASVINITALFGAPVFNYAISDVAVSWLKSQNIDGLHATRIGLISLFNFIPGLIDPVRVGLNVAVSSAVNTMIGLGVFLLVS